VREGAVEVRLSPAEPAPPRTGPPGPVPPCWREGGPDPSQPLWKKPGTSRSGLLLLGRPGGRRLSQPLLVWAGPLREPVEPCGLLRRVVSARGACTVGTTHSEGRTSLGGRLWGPGSSAGSLPPLRLGAGFRGSAGAGPSTCWSSLLEPRCPRGGGVDRAGVLAASVTASEEPCMSALCVQVLSRDPSPGRPDRASHSEPPGPCRIQWRSTEQPVEEQLTPNSASPANLLARPHQPHPSSTFTT
ncbi:Hypothetical protein GSB_151603, partial [Giardia duodenalis]